MSLQQHASEVVRSFARGAPGSPQNRFRFYACTYVQAGLGRRGPEHGLPRDIDALLDLALQHARREFGPAFVPALA